MPLMYLPGVDGSGGIISGLWYVATGRLPAGEFLDEELEDEPEDLDEEDWDDDPMSPANGQGWFCR